MSYEGELKLRSAAGSAVVTTDGTTLAVNGTNLPTTSDVSLASAAAGFGPPMTSGRWYLPFGTSGLATFASATAGRCYFVPIQFGRACTINGVAVDVTSGGEAGSVIRLGLYADAAGIPGALVADWGTTDGTSVAVNSLTPSTSVTAGWYWQAFCCQLCPTTRPTYRAYQSVMSARVGQTSAGAAAGAGVYFTDSVAGALGTFVLNGTQSITQVPAIWMKAA